MAEREDMRHEREALRSVLTDFVEERGLTDLLDLLRDVKECILPLRQLLAMTDTMINVATLARGGELNRRIMALNEKLISSHRVSALLSADVRLLVESDAAYRERLIEALPEGWTYTAEDLGSATGADLDAIGERFGCPRRRS